MNDDFTNVYEAEYDVCIRVKGRFLADDLEDLDKEVEEYVDDHMILSGCKFVRAQRVRAGKVAIYNLEKDEEVAVKRHD